MSSSSRASFITELSSWQALALVVGVLGSWSHHRTTSARLTWSSFLRPRSVPVILSLASSRTAWAICSA
ncbi:hypothetical protein [Cutibacterium avidum]|uniref:hypothetical protein n=1 Tax=Cutibacterium avidum TaxID=33010 RepID=UPI001C8455BF|nr:hypothetical protein [Cutibacterium avidum]